MNRVRCNYCRELVTSRHRHDFVTHACKEMGDDWANKWFAVDGGDDYRRRIGDFDSFTEMEESDNA